MELICLGPGCGQTFIATYSTRKYCSKKCSDNARKALLKETGTRCNYRRCRRLYFPFKVTQKYCSVYCGNAERTALKRDASKPDVPEIKVSKKTSRRRCLNCGSHFITGFSSKYCTVICSKDASDRKKDEAKLRGQKMARELQSAHQQEDDGICLDCGQRSPCRTVQLIMAYYPEVISATRKKNTQ